MLNTKELNLFLQVFANEQGIEKNEALALLLQAFGAYASKKAGGGVFEAALKDNTFKLYRVWTLVADDVVMDDPMSQWRVMDAIDEGCEDVEPGDVLHEEVQSLDMSRQLRDWVVQYMRRNLGVRRAKNPKFV